MGSGYLPVDTPPGTAPLPPGMAVPAMKGTGKPGGPRPPAGKRKARKAHPPSKRKASRR